MKYVFTLILLVVTLFANEKKQEITIGAGAFFQTQPYANVDSLLLPTPVIFFDNELFYARWSRFGMYFLGDKSSDFSWAFSLTLQPRTYGYDKNEVFGMNERKNTWEGGLAFSAKKENAYIEVMLLNDLLGVHKSWLVESEIGYKLEFGKLTLYPSLIMVVQSDKFLNYYYGTSDSEATVRLETPYTPNNGVLFGAQTYMNYKLTKEMSILLNIRADKLSFETTSSPIVRDDYIYSGLASLIYTFEY